MRVVDIRNSKYDVYIGRYNKYYNLPESKWANKYIIGKDGTREECIAKYKVDLQKNKSLLEDLYELDNKILGCWCKSENSTIPCHGDVLIELCERNKTKRCSLGIIGTAGRKDDKDKLNISKYQTMVSSSRKLIDNLTASGEKLNTLVSGGAAYADHVAINLFNEKNINNLLLFLPCEFDLTRKQFKDTGQFDYVNNPGGTANYYHRLFSKAVRIDSLKEIATAIQNGTKVEVIHGFKNRNTYVAENSDFLFAITFGNKNKVKDGGTADTVEKYIALKGNEKTFHLDLNDGEIYTRLNENR